MTTLLVFMERRTYVYNSTQPSWEIITSCFAPTAAARVETFADLYCFYAKVSK